MIKRLAIRTAIFAVLTFSAFMLMQPLTVLTGWPELMQGLKAAAILSWAELTVLWIRICVTPQLDTQRLALAVESRYDSKGMAILYCAHAFTWAVRITIFILLGWVL